MTALFDVQLKETQLSQKALGAMESSRLVDAAAASRSGFPHLISPLCWSWQFGGPKGDAPSTAPDANSTRRVRAAPFSSLSEPAAA